MRWAVGGTVGSTHCAAFGATAKVIAQVVLAVALDRILAASLPEKCLEHSLATDSTACTRLHLVCALAFSLTPQLRRVHLPSKNDPGVHARECKEGRVRRTSLIRVPLARARACSHARTHVPMCKHGTHDHRVCALTVAIVSVTRSRTRAPRLHASVLAITERSGGSRLCEL
jgi:hypothetical protein